jgi:pyruvate dehydrogenase E1 component alpha subunit
MGGEDRVVVVYFGDGATEEGTFHEAMNFAGVKHLPVIFVCENNLYSVHSALDVRQPERPIAALGPAHGVTACEGDGNDAEVVHRLAGEAVARARAGKGPTILEFSTYRWMEHCGPNGDTDLKYRSDEELAHWKERDPVGTCRARLLSEGLLSPEIETSLRQRIEQEIDAAFSFAKASPFPEASALVSHVYPAQSSFA